VIVDHVPHHDETLREAGHVWLGFEPATLHDFLAFAGMAPVQAAPVRGPTAPPLHLLLGQRPAPSTPEP
jgi:hypothetical protein